MNLVKQTTFSDETKGTHGNCFAACLASLTGVPLEDVPAFQDMDTAIWADVFLEWIDSIGWEYWGCALFNELTEEDWEQYPYLIVGGTSPRNINIGHAVIYYKGNPLFDPHPSDDFILDEKEVYLLRKKPDIEPTAT